MATVSPPLRPSPEHIFNTLNAHHQTAALKTAIELDLFTAIDEGKHRVEDLAEHVKASPRGVRILSDYLAILGFLKKEHGSYSLTPDAALFLSKHSRAYMGTMVDFLANERHYENFRKLTERQESMATTRPRTMSSGSPSLGPWRR